MNRDKQGQAKKRRLRTPLAKQARVTARRMHGQSIRQIAAQENISKDTVMRVLSQEETSLFVQGYRDTILQDYVPLAMNSLKRLLKGDDRQATIETLYGAKIFTQRQEIEKVQDTQRDYSYPKVEFFAKYGRWPSLEEAKEFEKTMDVQLLVKGELTE
jgi:hypothetical protein